jgi:hypothetical protein
VSGALAGERALLVQVKRLAAGMLADLSAAYGDGIRDQQEVLGHTADVIIHAYAIESGIARAEKIGASGGRNASVALDAARVFASDAADRVVHSAKQIEKSLSADRRTTSIRERLAPIADYPGVDTVAARRRIADAVIAEGRHPF